MKDLSKRRSGGMPGYKRDADGKPLCRWCSSSLPKGRRSWCSDKCVAEALIVHSPPHTRKAVFERDKGVCATCGIDTVKIENTLIRLRNLASGGISAYDRTENKASRRYGIEPGRLGTIFEELRRRKYEALRREREAENEAYLERVESSGIDRQPWRRRGNGLIAIPTPITHLNFTELRIAAVDQRLRRLTGLRREAIISALVSRGFSGIGSRSLWDADHIKPVAEGGGLCGLDNYQTLCQACHKAKTAEQARRKAAARRGPDAQIPLI